MKKKKSLYVILFPVIFIIVGLCFLAGGIIVMTLNQHFREKAVEITAEITDIQTYRDSDGDREHEVYVRYSYGDRTYEGVRLNFYSSNMYEGKEISVLCDPEDPRHIESAGGMAVLSLVFMIVGIIFTTIAVIVFIIMTKKSSYNKRMMASGRVLYAAVETISQNTGYTVNGQNPYIIYCTYRDEYKDIIYRFKSGNIWTNPGLVLNPGDTIKVYVDEKDYSRYYVDTESILEGKIVDYT